MTAYGWLKVIHVAAVVIFLGNIITGLFWHSHASRTRDRRLVAHAMAGIIRSDRLFTIPGVFLIIASGVATAMTGGLPILRTPWILWSLVLFAVSGVVFMARVAPLQRRLQTLAERGSENGSFDWNRYDAEARRWESWGTVALVTPLVAMALMILKPSF